MYEQFFGLNKRPFSTLAAGADVFVGPQTAKTMAALKNALGSPDAVATVTGPVGVGKTTLVNRALQAIGRNRIFISVGRMHLHHDDVLELLLDRFGLKQMPASAVQRFARFRRLLEGLAAQDTRVFIVVEDAVRIGCDALSELEALTAADAGVSDGANIVLMGGSDLNELLKAPQLVRMKQRIRLRESIVPLGNREMRAYLKHGLRQAGGDFDNIFDENTADLLHQHSEGIPRVANNMVETILGFATERKVSRITATFLTSVISDECGIAQQSLPQKPTHTDVTDAEIGKKPAPASLPTTPTEETKSSSERVPAIEPDAQTPENEAAEVAPLKVVVNDTHSSDASIDVTAPKLHSDEDALRDENPLQDEDPLDDEDPLPELIQDTFPSLAVLKPELIGTQLPDKSSATPAKTFADTPPSASAANLPEDSDGEPVIVNCELPDLNVDNSAETKAETSVEDDGIPMLSSSMRLESPIFDAPSELTLVDTAITAAPPEGDLLADISTTGIEDPECDIEPQLAELQPDLDALERAMAYTQGSDADSKSAQGNEDRVSPAALAPAPVPEITLDQAIQEKIAEATRLLDQTTQDLAEVAAEDAKIAHDVAMLTGEKPTDEGSAADEVNLDELSSEMAKLRTIEDVDEKMGETLFGEEFSDMAAQIAAHVAANPLPEISANDDSLATPLSVEHIEARSPSVIAESVVMEAEPAEAVAIEPGSDISSAGINDPARRFVTVTDLNTGSDATVRDSEPNNIESVVLSDDPEASDRTMTTKSLATSHQSDPIQDQINISLTQTLKALNVSAPAIGDIDDDDDDDEGENVAKGGFFSRFRRS